MKQIPNEIFFNWVEQEIKAGRTVRFRLKGHSMFPLLRNDKDEIILGPFLKEELRQMDVVLFKYKGKHLLHRILKREGNQLYIQGDGSFVGKEECTTDDVVGKVCAIVRNSNRITYVENWQWKLPSFIWKNTGIFRTFLLRILHHLK